MRNFLGGCLATLAFMTATSAQARTNPFLEENKLPHAAVPFDKIQINDYESAMREAMKMQNQALDAIVMQRSTPTLKIQLCLTKRVVTLSAMYC